MKPRISEPVQIQDTDLEAVDILIFKAPIHKPSLPERIIMLMQKGRHDSVAYANAVHSAIVTKAYQDGTVQTDCAFCKWLSDPIV